MQTASSSSFQNNKQNKGEGSYRISAKQNGMLPWLDEESSPLFSLNFKGASKMITFTHLELLQHYYFQNSKDANQTIIQDAFDQNQNSDINSEKLEEESFTRNLQGYPCSQNIEALYNQQQSYKQIIQDEQHAISQNVNSKESDNDQESQFFPAGFKIIPSKHQTEAKCLKNSKFYKSGINEEELVSRYEEENNKSLEDQKSKSNQIIVDMFFLLAIGLLLAQMFVFT